MKFGLRLMLVLEALFMFSGGLFGPLYALFVEQVGGSILDAGIAASIFLISTGLIVFVISKWENRSRHQEKMYIFGYLLIAVTYFGYTFVTNRYELFVAQLFLGIAQAIYVPVRDSLYTKFMDKGQEAYEWGAWETEAYIIPAIAALFGAGIASVFGFKTLFLTMSAIGLLGVGLGLRFFSSRKKLNRKR